jgi:hypothetical protein
MMVTPEPDRAMGARAGSDADDSAPSTPFIVRSTRPPRIADNGRMHPRPRALAGLAALSLTCAGCGSLGNLDACYPDACDDAAADGTAVDGASSEAGSGIYCGSGTTCAAGTQECCFDYADGSTYCTTWGKCPASDIFCDDPSQCPGGGTCWICVNAEGFQGTSCDYDGDIVQNDRCNQSNARALCHSSSQCEGGTTCQPFPVDGFDAGAGDTWFHACQ